MSEESASDKQSADNSAEESNTCSSHSPRCVFCKICTKEERANIVYEDSELVCFVDRKPVSSHHYLVVPRQHIVDARELTSTHVSLVERMADLGKKILREQGGTVEGARLGFHWPPLLMVRHLHLHVISPESELNWLNRTLIFRKDSYFFTSPENTIDYIKSK